MLQSLHQLKICALFLFTCFFVLFTPLVCSFAGVITDSLFVPNRVLVGFHEDVFSLPEGADFVRVEDCQIARPLDHFLSSEGARWIGRIFKSFDRSMYPENIVMPPLDRFFSLTFDDEVDVVRLCRSLESYNGVLFAEPDYYLRLPQNEAFESQKDIGAKSFPYGTGTSDLDWENQWNLDSPKGINCPQAWLFSTGSPSVRIGVIEDMFKTDHYDLDHIDLLEGQRFWEEYVIDPLGGGYWEQYMGLVDSSVKPRNHSTQSVGVIAAETNNERGIAGIAGGNYLTGEKGCTLIFLQVSGSESYTTSLIAFVIEQAVSPFGELRCDVLSMSFEVQEENPIKLEVLRAAICYANAVRANIVAAKGNNGVTNPFYPADFDDEWTTAVGSARVKPHETLSSIIY